VPCRLDQWEVAQKSRQGLIFLLGRIINPAILIISMTIIETETFLLDSRKVTINFNTSAVENPQLFIDVILKVCRKHKYALVLPEIVFDIEYEDKFQSSSSDFCGRAYSNLGIPTVELNYKNIMRSRGFLLRHMLKRTVVHEITHLWHDYVYQTIKKANETGMRLILTFPHGKRHFASLKIEDLRKDFFDFFRGIQLEGIAVYSEKQMKAKLPFSFLKFNMLMAEAEIQTQKLRTEFEKFKIAFSSDPQHDPQPLMNILDGMAKYDIGVHMVYTIISVRHSSLENVAAMQPFEFVKEYEASMTEKKLQPLFSATSGEGILDYKSVVAELTALWKRYNSDTK